MLSRLVLLVLIPSLLVSCGPQDMLVKVVFAPQFGAQGLSCGSSSGGVEMTDLRFFVHSVQLLDKSGEPHDVSLDRIVPWQQSDLALLDFEDGSGHCINGTTDSNTTLHGSIAARDYSALRFMIGVPFERNHADPLKAEPPLDDAAMHWHWRAGYKFLRAGFRTDTDGYWIHLGSTGCEGTVKNITGCRSPNRVIVQIEDFVIGRDRVIVDLAQLLPESDFEDALPTDCSSGPAESDCDYAFDAFGLSFDTDATTHSQRVFGKQAVP